MAVRPSGAETTETARRRALPRMIASAPWVVVSVGVAVLAVLLVVAALAFRGPEQPSAWKPGPAMTLPAPSTSDSVTSVPSAPERLSPAPGGSATSASPAASVLPSPSSRTASPAGQSEASRAPDRPTSAPPGPPVAQGALTATYRVSGAVEPDSFRAQMVVRNGTGESRDWQVELRFTGDVTGIRASSGPGVSVSIKGGGWYLLSGTVPLAAGAQQAVDLRFSRTGGGEYPAHCVVNGSSCAL
ncbi:hypothetical protein [Verrucosispora sp. NA02020]|uniref:hypothetical protein n=1 Tax=Verrucosispora sp. NA02020 TaxID=2742132 RepID=UPI001590E5DA|nr:hypothetical protein [Verrucosispora sp. NA02020]QKW15240.1 hypothetical protein HUT12_22405 [Verrucosispora sp. NA02020]